MKTTMKRIAVLLLPLLMLGLLGTAKEKDEEPLKVLFVTGPDSHGWGAHDHNPSTAVLSEALKEVMGNKVQIKTIKDAWPTDEDFAAAHVCVFYTDGWNRSSLKGEARLAQIEKFMNDGNGVLRIHWATGSDPGEKERHRSLFGGNMESNYSCHSTIWHQKFALAKHPVSSGMKPFELIEECYFHMHWADEKKTGVTDILTGNPGADFRAGSVTPKCREALKRGEPQAVAWSFDRPKGGRAFSYTGGHFYWNWANDEARKMILNAIVWSGGREVPADGLESTRPSAQRMLELVEEAGKKKNPGWTAERLQPLLDDMNQPGKTVDWRRPQFQ
ncbi:MAG: ThuA domain-containing protein [Akkermansiaceae bacterium]